MADERFGMAGAPLLPTALLVDDEAAVRAYASMVLRRGGFEVVEAEDGLDALSLIKAMGGAVSVLVTDIKMPRMSGIELADAVMVEFPEIPVVFISGAHFEDLLPDPDGRVAFLPKPFGPEAMLETVRGLVNGMARAHGSI